MPDNLSNETLAFAQAGPEVPIQQFVEGMPPLLAVQPFHQSCEGLAFATGFTGRE
jgi:hypothetical protein